MAAPTSVRAEATSITTVVLRWSHSGSTGIAVYRSTDGSAYTLVDSSVLSTATSFTDTGLATGTKYWYKLSDDLGSTFSSVVTVYTHFCPDQFNAQGFNLPRFDGGDQQADQLNVMAERIERVLGDAVLDPGSCAACPVDGAVIIDCTDGCRDFYVIADADINSITIQRCGNEVPPVTFIVPPSTTVGICGFPSGLGFTGDECTEAPISGGTEGRFFRMSSAGSAGGGGGSTGGGVPSKKTPPEDGKVGQGGGTGSSGGGAGGTGGADCTCVPDSKGQLQIKCCTDDCSLSCQGTKEIKLKVCGGVGPYSWTKSGAGYKFKGKGDESTDTTTAQGTTVTVRPVTNSGSTEVGKAYSKSIVGYDCGHVSGTTHGAGITRASYNCDDTLNTCPDGAVAGSDTIGALLDATCACGDHDGHAVSGGGSVTTVDCVNTGASGSECAQAEAIGAMTDVRTAGMISAGCAPCGLNDGGTVSVTDAAGVTYVVTLKS